jgi:signal transduction histidine kinase
VAFHWRIRHKLMLGLGLVVGLIALLLAGTLYGLESFRKTMKSIESKQAEWAKAYEFKNVISDLKGLAQSTDDQRKLARGIPRADKALNEYEATLQATLDHGRDPNKGVQELGLVQVLKQKLGQLGRQVQNSPPPTAGGMEATPKTIAEENKAIAEAVKALELNSNDLCDEISKDLQGRSKDARETFRKSLWIVFSTGIVGILLLCVFLRFFYRWVFHPIRDLEQGAGRVAQGDFDHRIEVHSGDEMEDLAAAFNHMTGRLQEMYRDLARQVNERSRQLVRSERLAGVGFLAAGVAHEINNPLASIAFCSEALEGRLAAFIAKADSGDAAPKRIEGTDREVITKYLKMIQEEAFRCKHITQRLLEFSRGGERLREPTELGRLIQSVLDMVQHLPNGKGKYIRFQPTGHLIAWVNTQEIKSVILNLVVNALDSMDDGGTLTITLALRDQMAEMVFSDTGCGMSPEILENIFEPFFTRSRTGKGTGLGLSISHRAITQHGGEIEAASAGLNQGSTFTVRLPLQPVPQAKEEKLGKLAA